MSKAKAQNRALPKKFYETVTLERVGDRHAILLDGKQIKTPARHALTVPGRTLANAIAEEWRAQEGVIDTDTMPLTRLANITLDRIETDRTALIGELVNYAGTDLVCYRTPLEITGPISATNEDLRAKQDAAFDPLIAWLDTEHAAPLCTTDSIMPIAQPATSLGAIEALFQSASDAELAALAMMVPLLGSAVIGLAVWKEKIDASVAITIAHLDEDAQAEAWGKDAEAERYWQAKIRDIRASAFYLQANAKSA